MSALDAAAGFIGDIEKSIELALDGHFGDAAKQLGMAFVKFLGRLAGGMFDMTSRMLRRIASAGQAAGSSVDGGSLPERIKSHRR